MDAFISPERDKKDNVFMTGCSALQIGALFLVQASPVEAIRGVLVSCWRVDVVVKRGRGDGRKF
ncbi:hypothetical protein DSUL_50335 [Desulfovibrionales bacterium]